MRFRSVLLFLCPVLLLWIPEASAQKRVFATVKPNTAVINNDADIYDPLTGTLAPAVNTMNVARENHVSIRLGNGKVLIAGGYNDHYIKSAEIYDPVSGSFTATEDNMVSPRSGAAGVLLRGGTALLIGGYNGSYISSGETYDPTSDTFTATYGSMTVARQNPAAVLMRDGNVLVIGGFNGSFLGSAEQYKTSTRTFEATLGVLTDAREGHTATLLSDGKVLVAGGCNNSQSGKVVCDSFLSSAEIYDPDTDEFTATGSMKTARMSHIAVRLPNGKVLIAGGTDGTSALSTAEIYDPDTGEFTQVGNLQIARIGATASTLSNGKILIAGGHSDQYLASAEIYDPGTGAFTALSSSMSVPRYHHAAAVLASGQVLLTGGLNSDLLVFDTNFQSTTDNISPNIAFSPDSKIGFVPYTGSGTVVAFSTETGGVLGRIITGGRPCFITPLLDGKTLAVVSVLDSKIFLIDMDSISLKQTYTFSGEFGFGSILVLSPDGATGYISSTSTGDVIKFDVATGSERGRLQGLGAPAQITVTKDGNTLLVVDTTNTQLVFVNSSSMATKFTMKPLEIYASTGFTIFNKAVLNQNDTLGIIASQDTDATSIANALFAFDPSTGAIIDRDDNDADHVEDVYAIGYEPGYTTLLPTGTFWLVLCNNALSRIPTWSPDLVQSFGSISGSPLGSANLVISPDAKYAYYTSAAADRIFQQDIGTGAVVGSFLVGDNPNESEDQASSLALTPDSKTMVVLNFVSNELNLLSDTVVLKQTKLISDRDKFTGLSVINVSDVPVDVTFTAISDGGTEYSTDNTDVLNPVTIQLGPNAQETVDTSLLFNLDTDSSNTGRVVIESDRPVIVGYSTVGQIHSSYLNSYISNLEGIPLYPVYDDQLHDYIIPEIPSKDGGTTELNFVNPNYNPQTYDITHYGADGTEMEKKEKQSLGGSIHTTQRVTDLITNTATGRVLVVGGFDAVTTRDSADVFDAGSKSFSTTSGILADPRQGHSSVLLQNGTVLIAGGKNGTNGSKILKSAEVYDSALNIFMPTAGTMRSERHRHTATLLPNGKVLLAGGQSSLSINRTAELFDASSGAFTFTSGYMVSPRESHTATVLPNGKVLLAGGLDGIGVSSTAEIYDPASATFSSTGSMHVARAFHTAVLLPSGLVLIAGGYNGDFLSSAELYDPQTGLFSLTGQMTAERSNHTCTLLSDGTVLIVGGRNSFSNTGSLNSNDIYEPTTGYLNSAEIYDPSSSSFFSTDGVMAYARGFHSATLLNDDANGNEDKVLIAGGFGCNTEKNEDDSKKDPCSAEKNWKALDSAELYNPVTRQFSLTTGTITVTRQGHTATLLTGGTQGYLRVTSDMGQLFTERYSNGGTSASGVTIAGATTTINGINVDKYVGVTKIYSPQFAISSSFETLLNIINANPDEGAVIALILHAADGSVLATRSLLLAANAQLKGNLFDVFSQNTNLNNQTGWLEIASSVDRVVGTISFTDPDAEFLASFELSGVPMDHFVFPLVVEDADYMTGIALLNSGAQPANVQLELWGLAGTLDGSRSITLAPGTRVSQTLSQLFPGMQPHHSGNIRIQSDQPIFGLEMLFDKNLTFLASVPPVAFPE